MLQKSLQPLSVANVKQAIKEDILVVDTRSEGAFADGFIPGSVFIGLEGRFAEWAGSLLDFEKPIILVTDTGKEKEAIIRLARVGFSKVNGYLDGGFAAWVASGEPIDMVIGVEADELAMDLPFDKNLVVVDVRRPAEFANGHVKDAQNIPLEEMKDLANISSLEETQNLYVHCAGGYRSLIAASLLKRQGMHNLRNVIGGWNKIKEETKIPTEKEDSVLN